MASQLCSDDVLGTVEFRRQIGIVSPLDLQRSIVCSRHPQLNGPLLGICLGEQFIDVRLPGLHPDDPACGDDKSGGCPSRIRPPMKAVSNTDRKLWDGLWPER
ncbi:MAG TPA: hypothetical protein VFB79_06230 [Candidatus Angelobacter sp.]|nr:hypothetical protein [Candidatus Angelobacter sp.]